MIADGSPILGVMCDLTHFALCHEVMNKRKRSHEVQRLLAARDRSSTDSYPRGCGVRRCLLAEHMESLISLCDLILSQVEESIPWGEGMSDTRRRCYGFVNEHSEWKNVQQLCDAGIVMDSSLILDSTNTTSAEHQTTDSKSSEHYNNFNITTKHEQTVHKCCATISLNDEQKRAVDYVISLAREVLRDDSEHLEQYEMDSLDISQLVCLQPNVHNYAEYLPLHLDQPRHDGFGVVIVTGAFEFTCHDAYFTAIVLHYHEKSD